MNEETEQVIDVVQKTKKDPFLRELENLINKHSKENDSNTPDYILAEYLNNCLKNFGKALYQRSDWYQSEKQERE